MAEKNLIVFIPPICKINDEIANAHANHIAKDRANYSQFGTIVVTQRAQHVGCEKTWYVHHKPRVEHPLGCFGTEFKRIRFVRLVYENLVFANLVEFSVIAKLRAVFKTLEAE